MKFKMNTTLGIALILAVFGLPAVAWAQATENGDVSADVQELPISLTQQTPLSFGQFMAFGSPGTVTVHATDGAGITTTNVHVVAAGERAIWDANGLPGASHSVTTSTTTTITNGSDTMDVVNIHLDYVDPTLDVDGAGLDRFTLGATLNVDANQPPGLYTGTYEITVAYN